MKILFFVYRYWPDIGGVEKYVHRLAKALQAMGHHVRLVVPAHQPGLPKHETHDGIDVYRFPGHRSPMRAWLHLMRMRPLFLWPDVIHVSNTHVLEYFYRMIAWTIPHRPVFLTRHGMSYIYPVPESEMTRAQRTLALSDGVIHDGYFIGTRLGATADAIPDQGLYPEARDLLSVPEPPPTSAVFVGRLDHDSGIEIYLDAIRLLKTRFNTPITLDVYGGGKLLDGLRRQVQRDGLPVTFHGWKTDAQDRITDGCFAFVAGRLAMQEAMARERLVVAAYVDPLKRDYVCGEPFSPYLVASGDPATIAERVAHYATHPQERHRMVELAYRHASRLSWKRTAAVYINVWTGRVRGACDRIRMNRSQRVQFAWRLRAEAHAAEQFKRSGEFPFVAPLPTREPTRHAVVSPPAGQQVIGAAAPSA